MKKQRALVVVHSSLVPPESLDGHTEKEIEEWRTEYDVISTLKRRGHEVRCVGVLDSLTELRTAIADWKPDIVFNLLEEFDGIVTYDQHVVAFLELMRQPYTGCNPRGLLLSRDKSLCKQLLAFHRVPTPQFTVFRRGAALSRAASAQIPTVREVDRRGCIARHRAGLRGRGRAETQGAHRVRARAGQIRCARRGIRRGSRALRRRAGQRSPDAFAGVGDGVRLAAGLTCRDRHAQGEVGQALSGDATASPRAPRRICHRRCSRDWTSCRVASTVRSDCRVTRAWTFA